VKRAIDAPAMVCGERGAVASLMGAESGKPQSGLAGDVTWKPASSEAPAKPLTRISGVSDAAGSGAKSSTTGKPNGPAGT